MADTVIEATGLEVGYNRHTVLDGLDFHLHAGEVVLVVGNSGCGKSTLLKTLIGLVPPRAGRISLFGRTSHGLDPAERGPLLRRCGVMFQYGALLNSLTVGENVILPLEMHTDLAPSFREALARARLELVGLGGAFDLYPEELSGGMRKRAALARCMALEPEVLLCDEPGSGLDPVTAAGIDHLLLALNRSQGMALVIITHELLSIRRLAGRIYMLDQGRGIFDGGLEAATTSTDPVMQRFFHPDAPEAGS